MNITQSISLFQEAQALFPGGVNSPVRAFRAVGGQPLFIQRGEGAYLFDVDGNRYIDYVLSWGPLITGHAHPNVVAAIQQAALRKSCNSSRRWDRCIRRGRFRAIRWR